METLTLNIPKKDLKFAMLIANRMGWSTAQTNNKKSVHGDSKDLSEISSAITGSELRKKIYKRIDNWKWNA
jgi:hypothetical protein